ncbi:MAG TPA: toprim domain-containing protein [Oligoflexus sp.]|uniref:toprim domain-containing protein n=1 Tax=Oligoflexus sp. TaxID=1971216 RepID=UPI002D24B515|nr:toprim domain-containing protein [Oligoflexus sp.]HYX39825.1 toprim domain-containing protein [Oligoflexus sp.]HYX39830.1 toprim domain-containing protein [Oligoflexus sp.]
MTENVDQPSHSLHNSHSRPFSLHSTKMNPELASRVALVIEKEHGGKPKGRHYQDVLCLRCGQAKAFTAINDPRRIKCNRTSCDGYAGIPWSEYAPSVYEDFKASFARDDDNTTLQQNYALSRGIPNFIKWGGIYAQVKIGDGSYKALGFRTSMAFLNYRVINPPFEKAKHWNDKDSEASKAYWVPSHPIDTAKPIYVAESPLKAMAILEVGRQAVSLLSAQARPQSMPEFMEYLSGFTDRIILAFDEGEAGRKCARSWYWAFHEKGKNVSVSFPIGGDWDSLLRDGVLNERFLDRCEAIGGADFCGDARNAIMRYERLVGSYPPILEYRCAWYKPVTEKVKSKDGDYCTKLKDSIQLMNGVLRPAYTLLQQPLDSEKPTRMQCFFAHYEEQGRMVKRLVEFDPREITHDRDFSVSVSKQTGMTFVGEKMELAYIKVNILKILDMPHVRAVERYGYDYEAKAFIFPHAAFTKDGRMLKPNSDGYYTELGVKPTSMESAIKNIAETGDVRQFYNVLYAAGREQGLMVAAYYVWTMCSALNFDIPLYCRNHPFLSISGKPGSGKSTLVTNMNTVFSFQSAYEGVIQGASTVKGILRTMAKPICVPIVLAENNKEIEAEGQRRYGQMDENSQLGLYNRQSGQTRANKDGSGTNKLPFDAGLIFSQNYEPFTKQSMKERVISVKIDSTEFTPEQKEAVAELQRLSQVIDGVVPLTGIGAEHYKRFASLAARQAHYIPECSDYMRDQGVQNDRNIYHHGNLLAALCAMRDEFGLEPEHINSTCSQIVQMAKLKPEQNMGESDTSAAFFEAFEALAYRTHDSGAFLEYGRDYIYDAEKVYVRLGEVCNVMGRNGYDVAKSPYLKSSLRQCGKFLDDKLVKKAKWVGAPSTQRCWVFKRKDISLPSQFVMDS